LNDVGTSDFIFYTQLPQRETKSSTPSYRLAGWVEMTPSRSVRCWGMKRGIPYHIGNED